MKRYLIRNGYEVIGETRTVEEAKAFCSEYVNKSASDCSISCQLKRVLTDDEITVLVYQYSTLYLETFVISQNYEVIKCLK